MSLAAGSRLGPYEIVAPLGAGGMGEVYRARDTRLDRTVAVKVLPAHLASDPEFRARFDREAHAIGALGHPNICVLHDVGQHDGTDFLVLEYLEGETLADRLKPGPLPPGQVLRYAIDIADALHTAHQARIVHRDLKPSNIMLVRRRGTGAPVVKLLDFGLARATGAAASLAAAVTVSTPLSSVGTVTGTVQYMAPEQLEGKPADERADVWAFGCVLYEMLTGKRAFEAQSQAGIIAAILGPAPTRDLSHTASAEEFVHLIDTCLQNDPGARWQNMGDVALQLRWIAGRPARAVPAPRARQMPMIGALAAILIAAAAMTGWLVGRTDAPTASASAPTIRFGIRAPEGASIAATDGPIALSPDGRYLAFSAARSGASDVWLHDLAAETSRRIAQSGVGPVFSRDGASLLFTPPGTPAWVGGPLRRVRLADGLTATPGTGTTLFGGSWNDQDVILAKSACCGDSGIVRMSAASSASTPVTKVQPGESHQSPQFLPDGRRFIYVVTREARSTLWLGSLNSTPRTAIMEVGSPNTVYAPPGYILHAKGHALIAQPVNPDTLRPEGAPVVIARDIDRDEVVAPIAVSQSGVLAYVRRPAVRLTWFTRTGRPSGHVGSSNLGGLGPGLASDSSRVAVERVDPDTGSSDIWLLDASRGTESRWTTTAGRESDPVWSPDGRRIVYTRRAENTGKAELLVRDVEGQESTRLFARDDSTPLVSDWSKDGRFIAFTDWGSPERFGIWMMPVAAPDRPVQIARAGTIQGGGTIQGRFSPDGRYIAYTSDESGRSEVYVQALPPATGRWPVSSNGGGQAMWRGDGKELFFIAPNGDVMAAAVTTSPAFSSGTAVPLFQVNIHGGFAAASDGQRFLVSAVEGDVSPIAIVVNWAAALQKR